MSEQRLIDLESKITHQEHLIEQLNEVISRQEIAIYQMEEKLAAVIKYIREVKDKELQIGKADEKPPHY